MPGLLDAAQFGALRLVACFLDALCATPSGRHKASNLTLWLRFPDPMRPSHDAGFRRTPRITDGMRRYDALMKPMATPCRSNTANQWPLSISTSLSGRVPKL